MRNFGLLFCFLLCTATGLKAERWSFHRYYNANGVLCLNSSEGENPWMRFGSGLVARYENQGWAFAFYRPYYNQSILKAGTKDRIWELKHTSRSLFFFENNTWDSIPFNDSMVAVSQLSVDRTGLPVVLSGSLWQLKQGAFTKVNYRGPDSLEPYFYTLLFDRKNNWYAYDGKAVVVNPQGEDPRRYVFNNAGTLKHADEEEYFYFLKNNKLNVYHRDVLIKEIIPQNHLQFNIQNIHVVDTNEIYIVNSRWIWHYKNGVPTGDSTAMGTFIHNSYMGKDGILWVSTNKGLMMQTPDSVNMFGTLDLGLRSENVIKAVPLGSSCMIIYSDSLPTLFRNGTYYHFDSSIGLSRTSALEPGKFNNLWCIAADSLWHYRSGHWTKVLKDGKGIFAQAIRTLRNGDLLVFGGKTFYQYDGKSWLSGEFPYPAFISPWMIAARWVEGWDGTWWLSLNKRGLYRYKDSQWTEYSLENVPHLYLDNVVNMGTDTQNHLYGVTCNTIVHFDGSSWTSLDTNNSDTRLDWPTCMAIDRQGLLWIGDNPNGGVEYYDGQHFHAFVHPPMKNIFGIDVDTENNKWFYSQGIISIYNERDVPVQPVAVLTENLSFYPNPVSSGITVEALLRGDVLQLFDLSGRMMRQFSVERDGAAYFHLQDLGRGMYLLRADRKGQACLQSLLLKE